MSHEIPPALAAYHPGVGHDCTRCGRRVVEAVETPGEPYVCDQCQDTASLVAPPEDELTRMALADPGALDHPDDRPTVWRLVTLILFAVGALAIVFWKR